METVDTAADVGKFSSLTLDAAGQGIRSLLRCHAKQSSMPIKMRQAGTDEVVDLHAASYNGQTNLSLALDGQGVPHISYPDASTGSLKYAHRTSGGWQIETIDTQTDAWMQVSWRWTRGRPSRRLQCQPSDRHDFLRNSGRHRWRDETIATGDVCPNAKPALALDRAGGPHISFMATIAYVRTIMIATSSTATGAWDVEAVASAIGADTSPAIACSTQIASYTWPGALRQLECGAARARIRHAMQEGTGWRIQVVDACRLDSRLCTGSRFPMGIRLSLCSTRPRHAGAGQLRLAYRDAAGWHVEDLDAPNQQPGGHRSQWTMTVVR